MWKWKYGSFPIGYFGYNLYSPHSDSIANVVSLLADRTNGRAIATLLRLSSVVVVCRL